MDSRFVLIFSGLIVYTLTWAKGFGHARSQHQSALGSLWSFWFCCVRRHFSPRSVGGALNTYSKMHPRLTCTGNLIRCPR
ncbi:hypothetical protein GGR55DRAFT_573070 [Xylaria sp. FL0064]|nr:hypothetical protein GGR55DRAFT_573070 [Xylaria sp. FL0064]